MATRSDVRKIALSFPEAGEEEGHFAFCVPNGKKRKGFAWVWMERIHPSKPRVPNPKVFAVRVANLDAKEILLMGPWKRFARTGRIESLWSATYIVFERCCQSYDRVGELRYRGPLSSTEPTCCQRITLTHDSRHRPRLGRVNTKWI